METRPAAAVTPRPAATVILARPAPEGVEVLMLERSRQNRFGAGYIVFPGGSIDPEDSELAQRWFGSPADAVRACAARELAEEAAVALTASGPRELGDREDPVEAISDSPPPADALVEVSRWIAPEFLEVRFDATFFAVEAPEGLRVRPDEVETERAWWAAPADVLEQYELWDSLMWPTYNTLLELERCSSVKEILELRLTQVPPPVPGP